MEGHHEAPFGDLSVSVGDGAVLVVAVESGQANRRMGNHTAASRFVEDCMALEKISEFGKRHPKGLPLTIAVLVLLAIIGAFFPSDRPKVAAGTPQLSHVDQATADMEKERAEDELLPAWQAMCRFKRDLPDPDSFKVASAFHMRDGAFCGTYRAKNGFGGMEMGAFVSIGDNLWADGNTYFRRAWKQECSDSALKLGVKEVTEAFQAAPCWMVDANDRNENDR